MCSRNPKPTPSRMRQVQQFADRTDLLAPHKAAAVLASLKGQSAATALSECNGGQKSTCEALLPRPTIISHTPICIAAGPANKHFSRHPTCPRRCLWSSASCLGNPVSRGQVAQARALQANQRKQIAVSQRVADRGVSPPSLHCPRVAIWNSDLRRMSEDELPTITS